MQRRRNLLRSILFVLLSLEISFAQQQDVNKTQSNPEVLRTDTELVQSGVTVFDKQGHFVDGLTKQDFELEVEGRRVPISFFESIVAGSARDREARIVPNLRAQVYVYRDNQRLISNALARGVAANRDPERIPFVSDPDFRQFSPDEYVLEVMVQDLTTAKSVSQQTTFYVE